LFAKVLSTNFAEIVPKAQPKPLSKKGKYQENYVKLNLNKFKKKTFANKKAKKPAKIADIKFDSDDLPCFTLSNLRESRISRSEAVERFRLTEEQARVLSLLEDGRRVYYESNPPCAELYKAFARVSPKLTIVIVPYLSLMYDRLVHLPSDLSGALLTASQNYKQQSKVYSAIKANSLDLLFLTPEKFMFETWEEYGEVGLVVIEEVQSVSEWSQSQRAAYIQLPSKVEGRPLLGLTVFHRQTSVSQSVRLDVIETLGFSEGCSFVNPSTESRVVSVSRDPDITTAVHKLLRKPGFNEGQVIVYTGSASQANSITDWLRAKGEKASPYHSKLTSNSRDRIQKQFLDRSIRVIVATIGFLVYEASVSAVIHASLPKSLESYLQLTVHSRPVVSHVLLSLGSLYYQRAQMFSNYVSRNDLLKLFKMFTTATQVQLAIEDTADALGIEKLSLRSLLSKLEKEGTLQVMAPAFLTGLATFNKMTPEEAARDFAVLSHVIAKGKSVAGSWRFSLGKVASEFGCTSAELVSALKKLEGMRKLKLELRDETYEVKVLNLPTDDALLAKTATLQERSNQLLVTSKTKLETCFDILSQYASDSCSELVLCSDSLAADLTAYLSGELSTSHAPQRLPDNLTLDVKGLIRDFSGMPQAKELVYILQGIHTNRTPISRWKASGCWGRYLKYDFFSLLEHVNEVLAGELDSKIDFAVRRKAN
jgi:hypothetical protein